MICCAWVFLQGIVLNADPSVQGREGFALRLDKVLADLRELAISIVNFGSGFNRFLPYDLEGKKLSRRRLTCGFKFYLLFF